jgi:hypothetical protein
VRPEIAGVPSKLALLLWLMIVWTTGIALVRYVVGPVYGRDGSTIGALVMAGTPDGKMPICESITMVRELHPLE